MFVNIADEIRPTQMAGRTSLDLWSRVWGGGRMAYGRSQPGTSWIQGGTMPQMSFWVGRYEPVHAWTTWFHSTAQVAEYLDVVVVLQSAVLCQVVPLLTSQKALELERLRFDGVRDALGEQRVLLVHGGVDLPFRYVRVAFLVGEGLFAAVLWQVEQVLHRRGDSGDWCGYGCFWKQRDNDRHDEEQYRHPEDDLFHDTTNLFFDGLRAVITLRGKSIANKLFLGTICWRGIFLNEKN